MWVYDYPCWTEFSWDANALSGALASVRHRQGLLLGRLAGIGFDLRQEASLKTLTYDVMTSSAIEGDVLNSDEVRSSLARRLGVDGGGLVPTSRHVDGVVEMMLDATQNYSTPLTADRLFDWHAALFPTGRSGLHRIGTGQWRQPENDPMRVVSGAIGREKIHFIAPKAETIPHEMEAFLRWFNQKDNLDPVLKAGIAHFWFVTIHPFEDGNGRIARAIGDMALARADGMADRFYSLSSQIEHKRQDYYTQLETQQRSAPDITPWLLWFLDCLGEAVEKAQTMLGHVLFKATMWNKINRCGVNERQRLVINRMMDEAFIGFMQTSKYAKLAKCSSDTALRDIQELIEIGVLVQNPTAGRNTSYRLADTN